jgi:hypothetical protein
VEFDPRPFLPTSLQEAFVFTRRAIRLFSSGVLLSAIACTAYATTPSIQATQVVEPNDDESYYPTPTDPATPRLGTDVDMYGSVTIAGLPGAENDVGHAAIYVRNSAGTWNRTATLKASDATAGDQFGQRVALIEGRAVVASRTAIYLFVKQASGTWLQTDKRSFAGAEQVSDLDWQGNTLAVGVLGGTYPNYLFVYDSSNTTSLRKVTRIAPPDASKSDGFATRVAAYGSTVAATAPGYNNKQGAAYIYNCGATSCAERQKILVADGAPGDEFGSSVDLNSQFLAIGAVGVEPHFEESNSHAGGAYLFVRVGSVWTENQRIVPTHDDDPDFASFGYDINLQGSRLIVSAPYGLSYWDPGVVFAYALQGSTFQPTVVMHGYSSHGVAISMIGEYVVVGTPDHSPWTGDLEFYKLP